MIPVTKCRILFRRSWKCNWSFGWAKAYSKIAKISKGHRKHFFKDIMVRSLELDPINQRDSQGTWVNLGRCRGREHRDGNSIRSIVIRSSSPYAKKILRIREIEANKGDLIREDEMAFTKFRSFTNILERDITQGMRVNFIRNSDRMHDICDRRRAISRRRTNRNVRTFQQLTQAEPRELWMSLNTVLLVIQEGVQWMGLNKGQKMMAKVEEYQKL